MKPSRGADPYWMLLPTLLLLFVFFVFPLGMLVKHSLFSWDLLTPARYVGLGNYRSLLRSGELWQTFRTTLSMSTAVVLGSMAAGLALALLLDRPGRFAAFVRGAVFSAYVVSWVSVGLLFLWLLDGDSGIIAAVWRTFAAGRAPHWLADPALAPWAVAAVTIWKITGYALVIFQTVTAATAQGASAGSASQCGARPFAKNRHAPEKMPESASKSHKNKSPTLTQETTYALNTAPRTNAAQRPGRSKSKARPSPAVIEPSTTTVLIESVVVNVCQSSPERSSDR